MGDFLLLYTFQKDLQARKPLKSERNIVYIFLKPSFLMLLTLLPLKVHQPRWEARAYMKWVPSLGPPCPKGAEVQRQPLPTNCSILHSFWT